MISITLDFDKRFEGKILMQQHILVYMLYGHIMTMQKIQSGNFWT